MTTRGWALFAAVLVPRGIPCALTVGAMLGSAIREPVAAGTGANCPLTTPGPRRFS